MAVKDRFGRFIRAGQAAAETVAETVTEPPTPPAEPEPTALARLDRLIRERGAIAATLTEHRDARQRWLAEGGPMGDLAQQSEADQQLGTRLAEIEAALPDAARKAEVERQQLRDRAWEQRRPVLEAAEQALADAFSEIDRCTKNLHAARCAAVRDGFGFEIGTRPPPPQQWLPFPISEYRMAIRRRAERRAREAAEPQPKMLEVPVEPPANWWPTEPTRQFVPHLVRTEDMEQISALAPARQIRMLHACRVDGVLPGHLRLKAGEEMWVPARSAFALTFAGVAVCIDGPPPTAPAPGSERGAVA